MLTIPEKLQKIELTRPDGIKFELVHDDPYDSTVHKERTSYKTIGMFKETQVMERCWQYHWQPYIPGIGDHSDSDFILVNDYDSTVAIPIQVRGLSYDGQGFSLDITHTKNGDAGAHYDPKRVPFFMVWSPFKYQDVGCMQRGIYIIPTEDTLDLVESMRVNPLNPNNKYSKYFEAWDLLDAFLGERAQKFGF